MHGKKIDLVHMDSGCSTHTSRYIDSHTLLSHIFVDRDPKADPHSAIWMVKQATRASRRRVLMQPKANWKDD